jgi:tetrahydromethanopterin S-methyltransferase subunit C
MSCQFQNLLGVPSQGVHSYRLFHVAIADVLLLVLFSLWLKNALRIKYVEALFIGFIIGVIAHRVFCVRTTLDRALFA